MLFQKRQQIAICVIAVLLVADFILFGYLPSYRRLKELEQAKAKQGLTIAEAQRRSGQLPILKGRLLELQKATVNHERQIPDNRDLGVFLQRIANLMNEHNLKEQQVQPGSEIEGEVLNCIPVNMQCKGKLAQIFEFYRRLQEMGRLVRIEQVKLVNDSGFNGEVSMQTSASVYYRTQAGRG